MSFYNIIVFEFFMLYNLYSGDMQKVGFRN